MQGGTEAPSALGCLDQQMDDRSGFGDATGICPKSSNAKVSKYNFFESDTGDRAHDEKSALLCKVSMTKIISRSQRSLLFRPMVKKKARSNR